MKYKLIRREKIFIAIYFVGMIFCSIIFGLAYGFWWSGAGAIAYLVSTWFAYRCVR